jgi:Holliday junction resolvasome RuvABC endonuclease subunit
VTNRIMGIDAGFNGMGVLVVEGRTVLFAGSSLTQAAAKKRKVRVADDDTARCQDHARYLQGVIAQYDPVGIICEMPSGGAQSSRAARTMGMATAIVAAVAELDSLPLEVTTPMEGKKAATRCRDATKQQVELGVRDAFDWGSWMPKIAAEREHVCDAAAAILAAEGGVLIRTLGRLGA